MRKIWKMNNNRFPERLRMAVSRKYWRRFGAFCDEVGIHYQTLHAYMRGSAYPSLEVFVKMADVLNVSLDWLVGRETITDGLPRRDTV